jgi:hypothetical protein
MQPPAEFNDLPAHDGLSVTLTGLEMWAWPGRRHPPAARAAGHLPLYESGQVRAEAAGHREGVGAAQTVAA